MLFQREFKRNLKALIIWTLVLAGLIIMMMSIYPQMAADQQALESMMDAYPEPLKKAFGMETLDFGTLLGFYGVEVYLITTLVGSIYAALLASGILVKEENDMTAEFLLSKPITRTSIVVQKGAAVVLNIVLLNAGILLSSYIGFLFAGGEPYSQSTFLVLMGATLLLHLTIAAVSFLLSAVMRRSRNIISLSLGMVFVSYFLSIIAGISDKMANLKYISVFKYVDAADIVESGAMNGGYLTVMIAVVLVCSIGALLYYRGKDIS